VVNDIHIIHVFLCADELKYLQTGQMSNHTTLP